MKTSDSITNIGYSCGFKEPTEGSVLFNGMDLYKNYQKFGLLIGYIPQESIVHDNLYLIC